MARGREGDRGHRAGRRRGRGRYEWPAEGPRPGDPASTGPRPPGSIRDGFWIALTGALLVVTLLQVVRLVWTITTSDQVQVTAGGAVLGFLVTVVWFLTIFWLVAGAWRRSVWGCPFEHTEDAHYDRRCQRHPLLPATRDAALQGADHDRPGAAADTGPDAAP